MTNPSDIQRHRQSGSRMIFDDAGEFVLFKDISENQSKIEILEHRLNGPNEFLNAQENTISAQATEIEQLKVELEEVTEDRGVYKFMCENEGLC